MEFSRIHHLAVICHDRQAALDFYVAKLGFKIIAQHQRPKQADWKIDLQQNNLVLELFIKPNAPQRPSYPEACGLRHLAFAVDDIQVAAAFLEKKGILHEAIRTDEFTGKKMLFFFDPDGLPLELHE